MSRRTFIGGSDARIIMGTDEAALIRLWHEKRAEADPEDLSGNLIVQLGSATEDLNRCWYERNTGRRVGHVQRHVRHSAIPWMAATLDGIVEDVETVFEAKFMLPWSYSDEAAAEKYMAQVQHNMWVTHLRSSVLSIITGGGKWVEIPITMDPLYLSVLVAAEKKFWRCVQTGEVPHLINAEPPRPRVEAIRIVDMTMSNSWAEFAALYRKTRDAFLDHERAKGELKALMPEDATGRNGRNGPAIENPLHTFASAAPPLPHDLLRIRLRLSQRIPLFKNPPIFKNPRIGQCCMPESTESLPDRPPPPPRPGITWVWQPRGRWIARGKYIRRHPRSLTPRREINTDNNSIFARAISLILPWSRPCDYPTRPIAYRELLGRVSGRTIRRWRNGGSMPGSMIERVAGWLEREGEKRLECARRLREEAPRWRKRGRPGREAHRVHAERSARETAERERVLNAPIARPNEPPDTRSECRRWVEEQLGRPLE